MRSPYLLASIFLLTVASSGCSALVDSTLASRGAPDTGIDAFARDTGPMPDTGPPSPCSGQPDGIHCTMTGLAEPFVCVHNVCELSRCGDGVVDMRMGSMHMPEECDDGNSVSGDGCETDCRFSCHANAECNDMMTCDGVETCDTMHTHACQLGTALTDGTACMIMATAATCHHGVCRAGMCGDGTLDAGEQCDDHNLVDGDGCQRDCTFTCVDDAGCQDGNACNGNETCTVANHLCHPAATPLDCNDMNPCTNDSCNMMTGCVNASVLVDADMDTYFAITTSCGGNDCNDNDPNAYPGAPEPCGSTTDLNCDGSIGTPPVWYVDCDNDGYAPLGGATMTACTRPGAPASCASGTWTSVAPTSTVYDCLDSNSSAHPTQSSYFSTTAAGLSPTYDWNCNSLQERQYSVGAPRFYQICGYDGRGLCAGTSWYNVLSAPACGSTTTLSHCAIQFSGTPLTAHCNRIDTTGSFVYCH